MKKGTTVIGFVNKNGQVVIRNTGKPGTDHLQNIPNSASKVGVAHAFGFGKRGAFDFAFPFRRVAASTHPVSFRVKVPRVARLDALNRCYAPL